VGRPREGGCCGCCKKPSAAGGCGSYSNSSTTAGTVDGKSGNRRRRPRKRVRGPDRYHVPQQKLGAGSPDHQRSGISSPNGTDVAAGILPGKSTRSGRLLMGETKGGQGNEEGSFFSQKRTDPSPGGKPPFANLKAHRGGRPRTAKRARSHGWVVGRGAWMVVPLRKTSRADDLLGRGKRSGRTEIRRRPVGRSRRPETTAARAAGASSSPGVERCTSVGARAGERRNLSGSGGEGAVVRPAPIRVAEDREARRGVGRVTG